MGLFGLAMFMAERRSKEISIRKVLGASTGNLCLLMSREFVLLVLLAGLIASPITMWFMGNWLKHYDYRIQLSWWIPVSTGVLAILIALGTVSSQAFRVAKANPSMHLKDE
jgi:ABC-type antimicrobial peptide transport system permease subunit